MSVLWPSLPYLLRGAASTVVLALAVLVVGSALGLALGLLRVVPWRVAAGAVGWAVEVVRAVPLLLLLLFEGVPQTILARCAPRPFGRATVRRRPRSAQLTCGEPTADPQQSARH